MKVSCSKEALSGTASYSILRHCALSTLFRYAPDRHIPYYASKNFITHFTYYEEVEVELPRGNNKQEPSEAVSESKPKLTIVKHVVTNHNELTRALDIAASKHLLDDNDNIILHIHCEFRNQWRRSNSNHKNHRDNRVKKLRQEATGAADHVVKTLKIWVQRATQFVHHHTSKLGPEDFVVVMTPNGTNVTKTTSTKTTTEEFDYEHVNNDNKRDSGNNNKEKDGMDWAARFVQALLFPETIHQQEESTKCHLKSNSNSKITPTAATSFAEQQLDQYEETIDAVADNIVKGFKVVSKFFVNTIVHAHQQQQKYNKNKNNDEVLSLSPSPSLAESASLSSSDEDDSDDYDHINEHDNDNASVEQEGVEIVFGCDDAKNVDCEEWKIFFGDAQNASDDNDNADGVSFASDELTLVDSPCVAEADTDDVISFSSSFAGESLSSPPTSPSSKVLVAEDNEKEVESNSDDVSWALLSDDEDDE